MYRGVDKHEPKQREGAVGVSSRVQAWKDAWLLCLQSLSNFTEIGPHDYHLVIEQWLPLINKAHGHPLKRLVDYQPTFYYADQADGPKEILQAYFGLTEEDTGLPMYILFNSNLFRKIQSEYCSKYAKNSQLMLDRDRGVINLIPCTGGDIQFSRAEYYKQATTWHLLFVAANHMLAHIDCFEKYDTASFDNHNLVKHSPFYKLYLFGRIRHVFSEKHK